MASEALKERIVLEGRLRYVGDGYESAWLALDGGALTDKLPGVHCREWVADPTAPVAKTTSKQERESLGCIKDGSGRWCYAMALFADWGRVRITIEPLEEAADGK